MSTPPSIWLSKEDAIAMEGGLRGLPQATLFAGACFWLCYRMAEVQGTKLGAVRCKLWQINSMNFLHAMSATYCGILFHVLSGEGRRTLPYTFAFSPAHVALIPWTLGFLVVEYLIIKNAIPGMDEGERITKLFRCSLGAAFIILQQIYPCVLGMHWLHWMQLCELRNVLGAVAWMFAAKGFSPAICNGLHVVRRSTCFACLVGAVAASLWGVQFAKEKELWIVPELPEGKAMLSILYLILLAGLALLTIASTWLEYQALTAGPLVLAPLEATELAGTEGVVGKELVEGEAAPKAKGKTTTVTKKSKKGWQKNQAE